MVNTPSYPFDRLNVIISAKKLYFYRSQPLLLGKTETQGGLREAEGKLLILRKVNEKFIDFQTVLSRCSQGGKRRNR